MASELSLVLWFEGEAPTEEELVRLLDCEVIEYEMEDV